MVASFLLEVETKRWRQICVIEGCGHRMGPASVAEINEWESCDRNHLPAFVVHEKRIDVSLGLACPHHVGEILAAWDK